MSSTEDLGSGKSADPDKNEVLHGLYRQARSLKDSDLREEALEAYDRVLELVLDDEITKSHWFAAASLRFKVELLLGSDREDEALQLVDPLRQYTQDEDVTTREFAWNGLQELISAMSLSERWDEQLSLLEVIIEEFDRSSNPDKCAGIGRALLARAATLDMLDRDDEADLVRGSAFARAEEMLTAIDRQLSEAVDDGSVYFARQIAGRLLAKALILREQGDRRSAVEVMQDVLDRYGDSEDPLLNTIVEGMPQLLDDLTHDPESG